MPPDDVAAPGRRAAVLVVGAGQAGLSTAYHLRRRGFEPATGPAPGRTYAVLDADAAPGGAWQHRWESLRMSTVNGIFDLPGAPLPPVDPDEPSRTAVPRYFAAYERDLDLPVHRPVRVERVERADEDPAGDLVVTTDAGTWRTSFLVNATGTWTNPHRPAYPGADTFRGRQLHTGEYVAAEELRGHRVAVVGGGISAVQLLEEVSRVAWTAWYTRREPVFHEGAFEPETTGREVIARVTADAEAGHAPRSVVSYTGLGWSPAARAARDRGVLVRRPMFTELLPHGVREADGTTTTVDVVLWATGFRPALDHLARLDLRSPEGGVVVRGTRVVAEPRVHLVGFGPSQSTVGANRAGRDAVADVVAQLRARAAAAV
ncbi:NAD(P)-binding domain-containing protein [Pseudokineococcus lusitanus]|uniref:Cation diffusion facilitator CzcD-associated flavoprotein CzcO n=1 Tax=Pseudokineococcus lusitanus TaxID=763993 RepID=A0A3N1HR43_9ACTN|nr:NAD(P)-binding domain-containing protein [Pseudokineococcus lusitanus]ROP44961.1 cation diffusion facilitator CzcD-associated flavoprotein CzcO [Pseudokineococcus lusitanus]